MHVELLARRSTALAARVRPLASPSHTNPNPKAAAKRPSFFVEPIRLGEFALKTAAFGVGGWAIENAIFGPRYSSWWRRARIPFLPVYAVGGAAVLLTAPQLKKRNVPWWVRLPIYAALLTGIEYVGCQIDRRIFNACSWDYSKQNCGKPYEGCIDLKHAAVWGALGLVAEGIGWIGRQVQKKRRLPH